MRKPGQREERWPPNPNPLSRPRVHMNLDSQIQVDSTAKPQSLFQSKGTTGQRKAKYAEETSATAPPMVQQ